MVTKKPVRPRAGWADHDVNLSRCTADLCPVPDLTREQAAELLQLEIPNDVLAVHIYAQRVLGHQMSNSQRRVAIVKIGHLGCRQRPRCRRRP